MTKYILYVFFVQALFTSCQPEWKAIFKDEQYFDTFVCVPVISKGRDSIMRCSSLAGFYDFQYMKLISYKEFCNELYECIEKKECLEVDSALYDRLYLHNRIQIDSTMLKLYNEYGIDSLLKKYLQKESEALFIDIPAPYNYEVNFKYILYLCSLHHIYFEFLMTEDAYGWYLWYKR